MTKIKIALFSIIFISIINGFCGTNENPITTQPVLEATEMPGWEKQIIEYYGNEEGSMPVIYRGAAKNWEAATWTPEYFAEDFGNIEIGVLPQKILDAYEGNLNDEGREAFDAKFINTIMGDHINDITLNAKNAAYFIADLSHNFTEEELKESFSSDDEPKNNLAFLFNQLDLQSQTQFPRLLSDEEERSYSLLIGSSNTISSLHSHDSTFLSQIYGKKLATLINPKYIEKCYCHKHSGDEFVFKCDVDILNPNFKQFPELENIEIYQTILEPGDVLYIPSGWLHDIRALTTSISIASGF